MKNGFHITYDFVVFNEYAGADTKKTIIYEGEKYLLKLPSRQKNIDMSSYINNIFSEYIGSHIFNQLGLNAQQTYLGTFQNQYNIIKTACACKNFSVDGWELREFQTIKNSYDEDIDDIENGIFPNSKSTEINEIEMVIQNNSLISNKKELLDSFWDMFIVDALIGNYDRHNGNWGVLINNETQKIKFAPVYDCGSSLYSRLADEAMEEIINNQGQINDKVYNKAPSALTHNNKKINYYNFINSLENESCNEALLRIVPRIKMEEINQIINNTPYISEVRKEFYKTILENRYEKILVPAYKKVLEK